MADCEICGKWFHREADEGWKRLCYACWLDRKNGVENKHSEAEDRIAVLEAENEELWVRLGEAETELKLLRAKPPKAPPLPPSFDSEQWRRLVQLCHPDRHGGSEAALKATQWLQAVRPLR